MIQRRQAWVLVIVALFAVITVSSVVVLWDAFVAEYYHYRLRDPEFLIGALEQPKGTPRRKAATVFLKTPGGSTAFCEAMGLFEIDLATPLDLPPKIRSAARLFDPHVTAQGSFGRFLQTLEENGLLSSRTTLRPQAVTDLENLFVQFTKSFGEVHTVKQAHFDRLIAVADRSGQFIESPKGQRVLPGGGALNISRSMGGMVRDYSFLVEDYPELSVFFRVGKNCRDNFMLQVLRLGPQDNAAAR